jgi:4-hydroxythreonine-4-phosphate dehydrogenase
MPISLSGKKNIAITLGDPAGIGPEVALKAVASLPKNFHHRIILLGPRSFYSQLTRRLGLNLRFKDLNLTSFVAAASRDDGFISCLFDGDFPGKIVRGRSFRRQTVAAVRSIELAVRLAMKNEIDAIVTPPINKAGLKKAGFDIPGHTEYLAKLSNTNRYEMMLVGGGLRVVLVTRHTPLKDVPRKITRRRVEEAIFLTDLELRKSFGIKRPRLVVCGLNPHAGEQGNIGTEEIKKITPAVRNAKKKTDSMITGPLSPDVLFHEAAKGHFDAEICMYHDQGLIPLKMISRGSGVNVTLGLPFVRTSPDHGTGYDIAAGFTADPGSMIAALQLALRISRNREKYAYTHRGS